MAENNGMIPISEVVTTYLDRKWESGMHLWARAYSAAVDTLADLSMDVMNRHKIVALPVDAATRTVALPSDYVNYIMIGRNIDGNIVAYGYNPRLAPPKEDECGDEEPNTGGNIKGGTEADPSVFPEVGYWYWTNGRTAFNVGRAYGHGGGFNADGYYRVDEDGHRIIFSSNMEDSEILLQYITSGFKPGEETLIPIEAKECLIRGIHWRTIQYKRGVRLGDIEMAKKEFFDYRRHLRKQRGAVSLYEIVAAWRRSYKARHLKN